MVVVVVMLPGAGSETVAGRTVLPAIMRTMLLAVTPAMRVGQGGGGKAQEGGEEERNETKRKNEASNWQTHQSLEQVAVHPTALVAQPSDMKREAYALPGATLQGGRSGAGLREAGLEKRANRESNALRCPPSGTISTGFCSSARPR